MTPEEVEALVHRKSSGPVTVRTLTESLGEDAAYLSYSIDDRNQLTIWHTEVPSRMQHRGVGGLLVERALKLANDAHATLRLVCPFAKDYLTRHPTLREPNTATTKTVVERDSLESGKAF